MSEIFWFVFLCLLGTRRLEVVEVELLVVLLVDSLEGNLVGRKGELKRGR